ncbi:MAG: hypothetical protein H7Y31_06340 [Chitinophagaceae bacterium]|nr:hypothetical protein [Chitinophagaceae bacterium]
MKRLLVFVIVGMVATVLAAYFVLPESKNVTAFVSTNTSINRVLPLLTQTDGWQKWWPQDARSNDTSFIYNGNRYYLQQVSGNIVQTDVLQNEKTCAGSILLAPSAVDTTMIEWRVQTVYGTNPITKLKSYFSKDELQHDLQTLLDKFRSYAGKQENIYGMTIQRAKVVDTLLVAMRSTLNHYPTTGDVYSLVEKLRTYIKSQNAKETNPPMLNMQHYDTSTYEIMVGIPIDRELPANGPIQQKRLVSGNIMWGEVRGGSKSVDNALQQLENYKFDYRLGSPAIPFASLITDRSKEPDTTKWITRVYYPIY